MASIYPHHGDRAANTAPVQLVVHTSAKRQHKAALHQLSIYGCRLAGRIRATEGETLSLRFDRDAPIAATVIWCEGGIIGARFDEPIERERMRSLSKRLP